MGAGASYGKRHELKRRTPNGLQGTGKYVIDEGIPVVNEINEEITTIIEDIKKYCPNYNSNGSKAGGLIIDLIWLRDESKRHLTVDTFAKKLFLQGNDNEFDRLKKTLAAFFMLVQLKYPTDKRYDAFLANILTYPGKRIPDDITILTWNYDSQFEISYREFNQIGYSTPLYWVNVRKQLGIKDSHDEDTNEGKIFKLNGTAIFDYFHSFSLLGGSCGDGYIKSISSIAKIQQELTPKEHLHFAWETDSESPYMRDICQNLHDAEVIVVIGYTFPYFNRAIDRTLFEHLLNLKKIYIQDPCASRIKQNIEPVLADFHRRQNIQTILLNDVDQFYIPSEL